MSKAKGSNIQDELLWDDFRAGDPIAYTSLIKKFSNPMFRYGFRFIQNEDFLKDCIQDIFLDLWNKRENIKSTASVKSYLFKSVRLRIFREKPKWTSFETLDDNYSFEIEFNAETKLIEEQTKSELQLRISSSLNRLPKRQKEIIYLRFFEGLDHDKISHVMGLSKQSTYNLLHESLLHLKDAWFQQVVSLLILFLFLI